MKSDVLVVWTKVAVASEGCDYMKSDVLVVWTKV